MASPPAQVSKAKGNAAFKSGDYPTAIGHYTSAILSDPADPTFPLNRAAAYLKLGKNADAERDCSTVLKLSPKNAKAHFRRGQARLGLGANEDAKKDFTQALKLEPTNSSIKQELEKVEKLIEEGKRAKPRTRPIEVPVPPPPQAQPKSRERRIPITIVEPTASSPSTSKKPTTTSSSNGDLITSKKPTAPASNDDLLNPLSSRPLSTSPSPSPSPSAQNSHSLSPTPPPAQTPTPTPPTQNPRISTFQSLKSARESTKPSLRRTTPTSVAGGGVFRRDGGSTLFSRKAVNGGDAGKRNGEGKQQRPVEKVEADGGEEDKPLISLFAFTKRWEAAKSDEERWALIELIPPTSLPTLFQTSLEPSLLVQILNVFLWRLSTNAEEERVRGWMENFGRVPRFGTVVMLLSGGEREVVRRVWGALGVGVEGRLWG